MTPNAQISVCFQPKGDEQFQIQLADLDYKPQEGGSPVMVVKDTEVELPDGSSVVMNSAWTPSNNMLSLLVFRSGRLIGHSGNCWHWGDPYLGIQIEDVGFLHIYLRRQRPTELSAKM